ncbi:MAG: hypothetical protein IH571_01155 [Acholeplasmataceae bacterium]|nr:hypothetical protein [Acholeplasmataceae bacterium]
MRDLVKSFDNLPWIAKFILALPILDGIAWGIYRLAKGLDKKDNVLVLAGILWIFLGIAFLWIIDLITVILYGRVTVFA